MTGKIYKLGQLGLIDSNINPILIELKNTRKTLGLTLRDLETIGISNFYLSQLENLKINNPSFKIIINLHNFYENIKRETYLKETT